MLLFSICLPLQMKETTPLWVIIFCVNCSVGTSFKTCRRKLANLESWKEARIEMYYSTL